MSNKDDIALLEKVLVQEIEKTSRDIDRLNKLTGMGISILFGIVFMGVGAVIVIFFSLVNRQLECDKKYGIDYDYSKISRACVNDSGEAKWLK